MAEVQDVDVGNINNSIHSSLLRKVLPFPGRLQVHRQVMMASIAKQFVPLSDEDDPILEPEHTWHIPKLHGLYLRTAFMLWNGWNVEDAAVISRSAADRMTTKVVQVESICTATEPQVLASVGNTVRNGTILGSWALNADQIDCGYPRRGDRNLFTASGPIPGVIKDIRKYTEIRSGVPVWHLQMDVELEYYMTVGCKISNLHASKSIISRVVLDEYMPHDIYDNPVDLIVSPYAIPRRMAPSTIMEMMLCAYIGRLGEKFGRGIRMVIDPYDSNLTFESLARSLAALGMPHDLMTQLKDGRCGRCYEHRTLVGNMFVGRVHKHPQDMLGFNNQMMTNFRGTPVRGIGTQRLGREEVEVLMQYGAEGMINELMELQSQNDTLDRIGDLVECLGYEVE